MKTKQIKFSEDFSEYPAGRTKKYGPKSAEAFRDDILIPALKENDKVVIDLNGTAGFGSSFLEEAFGGSVRELEQVIKNKIEIISSDNSYIVEINEYIDEAEMKLCNRLAGRA